MFDLRVPPSTDLVWPSSGVHGSARQFPISTGWRKAARPFFTT